MSGAVCAFWTKGQQCACRDHAQTLPAHVRLSGGRRCRSWFVVLMTLASIQLAHRVCWCHCLCMSRASHTHTHSPEVLLGRGTLSCKPLPWLSPPCRLPLNLNAPCCTPPAPPDGGAVGGRAAPWATAEDIAAVGTAAAVDASAAAVDCCASWPAELRDTSSL